MNSSGLSSDAALLAVRTALADAGHNVGELLVLSLGTDPRHIVVRYNPDGDLWELEEDRCTAYAETLKRAGWGQVLDLESFVLIPAVPDAMEPGQYAATWQIAVEGTHPADAAAEARGRQLDAGVTEALWTMTDHLGRTSAITTYDNFRT
ncbi:hypothetical protein [Streptomyces anulatus]|uniref:hypothetical protein n=1 Tax=Streptomyces anulatus TaxID=1892 RepID=UPI001C2697BA|nr:hypothetical protein [Streptomyces anulatus]